MRRLVFLVLAHLGAGLLPACSRSASVQVSAEASTGEEGHAPGVDGERGRAPRAESETPSSVRAQNSTPDSEKPTSEAEGPVTQAEARHGDGSAPGPSSPGAEREVRRLKNPRRFSEVGGTAPERVGCATDADCAVSCIRDGGCCDELCGCSQVYNRKHLAALERAKSALCDKDVPCPVARCSGRKRTQARCIDSLCAAVPQGKSPTLP